MFLTDQPEGDPRAYKLRKAVNLGYLDFSTLERRYAAALEEVRVNAELAPGVYRRVLPVVAEGGGVRVVDGPAPLGANVIDRVVEMSRLSDSGMFPQVLAREGASRELLEPLIQRLVRFHREAPRAVMPPEDLAGFPQPEVLQNLRQLKPLSGVLPDRAAPDAPVLDSTLLVLVSILQTQRFVQLAQTLQRRRDEGFIKELHGDLHAGNIHISGDGASRTVIIYDRIEFEPLFRACDPAAEAAMLGKDLAYRGFPGVGASLAREILQREGDDEGFTLLPLYWCHYAAVRAKVHGLRQRQGDATEAERVSEWRKGVKYGAQMAGAVLEGPVLVMLCGLPGSGKSYLAERLGHVARCERYRSDEIRKELAGLGVTDRSDGAARDALYSREMSERVYGELLQRAETALRRDEPGLLLIDANLPTPARRREFAAAAYGFARRVVIVHVTASEETTLSRLRARAAAGTDASDADVEVYHLLKSAFIPPTAEEGTVVEVNERIEIEVALQRVLAACL